MFELGWAMYVVLDYSWPGCVVCPCNQLHVGHLWVKSQTHPQPAAFRVADLAYPLVGFLHPHSQPLSTKPELTHTHIQLSSMTSGPF